MSSPPREPDPLEKTAVDRTAPPPVPAPPPLPQPPALDVTISDNAAAERAAYNVTAPTRPPPPPPVDLTIADTARGPVPERSVITPPPSTGTSGVGSPADFATLPATSAGSFTTSLAATVTQKIRITIPDTFLAAGTPGNLLRLVPVEILRGRPPLELLLKSAANFTLGRSPEADWITAFFPRSDKNDLRSKRLSKLHARIEYRDGQLWAHRAGSGAVHIGAKEISHDPAGTLLRERDRLVLAEDYSLEIYYDISLQGTLQFANGEAWQNGRIEFAQALLGAVRFEPMNSALAIRNSCWLFVDVGFGSARGGVLTAGAELAPQQGVFLSIGGCFWMLNLVNNEKLAVNEYRPASQEIIPLTTGDSIWLGAARYRAEIG